MTTSVGFPRALHELEEQFAGLAPQIPDGPEKQAISVLHGIVMEVWRNLERDRIPQDGLVVQDIADLWKTAPPMEGAALNDGRPVGAEAPDFALPDASGELVRLSDFRGRPVVLVFYPLDWSPGCSQQLDLYQQEIDELTARGAQLLAVSVNSVYSHGACVDERLRDPLALRPAGGAGRRARRGLRAALVRGQPDGAPLPGPGRRRVRVRRPRPVPRGRGAAGVADRRARPSPVVYAGGELLVQPTIRELQWALARSGVR